MSGPIVDCGSVWLVGRQSLNQNPRPIVAGRVGFEPTWVIKPNSFSRRARSTTLPPSRGCSSERRPGDCRTARCVATLGRLERPTSSSAGKRSNPLSYRVMLSHARYYSISCLALQAAVVVPIEGHPRVRYTLAAKYKQYLSRITYLIAKPVFARSFTDVA